MRKQDEEPRKVCVIYIYIYIFVIYIYIYSGVSQKQGYLEFFGGLCSRGCGMLGSIILASPYSWKLPYISRMPGTVVTSASSVLILLKAEAGARYEPQHMRTFTVTFCVGSPPKGLCTLNRGAQQSLCCQSRPWQLLTRLSSGL